MMSKAKAISFAALLSALLVVAPEAQEGFGFGSDAESPGTSASPASGAMAAAASGVSVGGSVDFAALSFYDSADDAADTALAADPTGRLDFEAKGSSAEAVVRLEINKAILGGSPEDLLDEAYARAYIGSAMIEGGYIKLPWGKADSRGPLNVLNPMDLTDLTATDEKKQRIAVPMLHAAFSFGGFTKLELAFLPLFEGDRYAWDGRWAQKSIVEQKAQAYGMFYYGSSPTANGGLGNGLIYSYYQSAWSTAYAAVYAQLVAALPTVPAPTPDDLVAVSAAAQTAASAACAANAASIAAQAAAAANDKVSNLLEYPDTHTLEYAQGGIRFTTKAGPIDLGLQYFYGLLPRPAANADPAAVAANGFRVPVSYNRYHQAGADFAAVLAGFNLRGELAANITEDLEGDDPQVYNPAIAFAFGLDHGLPAGFSLNLQYAGTYRLKDELVTSAYDVEYGSEAFSSNLTADLSTSYFKDALKLKATVLWELDDEDFLILPSLAYAMGDAELGLSAGIFAGDEEGSLGQYADSSYVKATLSYKF
jgi:hypothetical protein